MDDYGYEECTPSVATAALDESNAASSMSSKSKRNSIFRRGSLFGGSAPSAATKPATRVRRNSLSYVEQDVTAQDNKPKNRHSKRRGSISASLRSAFAPNQGNNGTDESVEERLKQSSGSSRRKSFVQHTVEDVAIEDSERQPQKGDGRKRGGRSRRSSLFHVGGGHMGSSSRDAVNGSTEKTSKGERGSGNNKSTKFNPFRRSATTTTEATVSAATKKKKKPKKKKASATDEILRNFEEMEDFVKAIQKDPKSLKLLQDRLQKEQAKGGFCSAA